MQFFQYIKESYKNSLHLYFAYSLVIILLTFIYRYSIYDLNVIINHNSAIDSFLTYLSLSMHYDAITTLILLGILFIFFLGLNFSKKFTYSIIPGFLILCLLVYLLFIEFFRIYETTFQMGFLSSEQATGIFAMLSSLYAELSGYFYIKFLVFSLLIGGMTLLIYSWDKSLPFEELLSMTPRKPHTMILQYYPAVLSGILIIIALFSGSQSRYRLQENLSQRSITLIHEISLNPILNLIYRDELTLFDTSRIAVSDEKIPFQFRFNTDSVVSDKVYQRQFVIPRGKKYNIIFYLFESTPSCYLKVKCNGSFVMKTWNRLAKNSFIANNHYANYPLSANALLSIMTSSYGLFTKDHIIQKYPKIKLKTASEFLKDQGYRTFFIHTGELGYAGQHRFLRGRKFDKIIELKDMEHIPPYNKRVGWGLDERAMIKPAVEFIQKDKEKPFFAVFMPVNPHHPYAIPDAEFDITKKMPDNGDFKKRALKNYLNSLHFADAALGQLIDTLEKNGLMENTLVFLIADHGEAFYQHRMNYNHPLFIYEENVHVPFMIYNKSIFSEPFYYDGISRHIDILPTLLDILQIKKGFETGRCLNSVKAQKTVCPSPYVLEG